MKISLALLLFLSIWRCETTELVHDGARFVYCHDLNYKIHVICAVKSNETPECEAYERKPQ